MDDNQLRIAAFSKMVYGEQVSLADAKRVAEVWLRSGMNIDTSNQQEGAKLVAWLRTQLKQIFFTEQPQQQQAPQAPAQPK